jgi:hypothetical protein
MSALPVTSNIVGCGPARRLNLLPYFVPFVAVPSAAFSAARAPARMPDMA